jgi:hypothetical protein
MSASLIVTAILLTGATSALRRKGHNNDLITPRPYNNHHSDATAARDERTLLAP